MQTRKPTGKPPWPILLLAGREKAGKTWAALTASASPLIGRTLYIGIGEDDPDEYALIPGADFDIVVHDGTYPGILTAIQEAVAEPHEELPTLIVVDSMTRLWNLIGDNMQAVANKRAKGRRNPNGDFTVSADLWNVAASQWTDIMDALRTHKGPIILTARLDSVAVMENGQPTAQKEWKIQGHKSLPFDSSAIVEMRSRGEFLLTGARSARIQLERPRPIPSFTVDWLWAELGLADGTGERTHATVHADQSGAEPAGARPPRPSGAERVKKAVEAFGKAADLAELNNLWKYAEDQGLAGVAEVKSAHEERKTALEGTAGPAPVDEWAAAPIKP
ncbi:AAA family ATPase [Microbacterium sp. 1P06AB]|uniref:AAA family ATPase n=1 Tax=Microbacterium sp. 1P06AB TaxID=3132289 RepID=UPI0039A5C95A